MKKITLFLVILSIAVLVYGIVTTKEIKKTFEINDKTGLVIDNINGTVNITGWDKDFVDVVVTKKTTHGSKALDMVDVIMMQKDDIILETKHLTKNPKVTVIYEINVPKKLLLKNIRSSNGSINITDAGDTDIIQTSNGSINIRNCTGKITVNTSNGSITAEDIKGSVIAHTSNGRIRLENITGFVDAITSNGGIQIYNVVSIGNIKTSNGSIKAHIAKMSNDVDIKSSNGSITLYLANSLDADIKASTSNGKIRLHDFTITADNISKSYVSGFIGNGGNLIDLKTSNSNIHIYNDKDILF
ncbi:MAG: DUF4097 family beta strand repeat-containing protein [Candidatus Tenebribacter burtonii]|jgi:hypothetical protein|nr:DUF4097 family beta strand repeat-containing protein [Candidatus Tenebribacter burtonii]